MATVSVSRRGVESIRRGHPWIFRSAVVQHSASRSEPGRERAARPDEGAIVSIVDEGGQPLGCGVWDPVSPIAVRVWSLDPRARLDAAMFRARLERAIEIRRRLFADGATTAYRLVNGEGDRVPAFVVDRYGDVAVLRIDGDAARAVSADLLRDVEAPLRDVGIATLLERTGRRGEAPEIRPVFGPAREKVEVKEHGVPFVVDLRAGRRRARSSISARTGGASATSSRGARRAAAPSAC